MRIYYFFKIFGDPALLAKQGWRFLQHPHSLVAKVYQEKYISGGTFLDSELGSKPSFAWRSIWQSKKLLKEGLLWRLGDGESIQISGDRWVPYPLTYAIQSPVRVLSRDARVSALIDPHTSWWNFTRIQEVFSEEEVLRICSLAISPGGQLNKLVWKDTKNGIFTVKSAYYLARSIEARYSGSASSDGQRRSFWKTVWNVRGPPVVKLFLWKACRNALAAKDNFHRRKIIFDPCCPICGLETETVEHIL